jgi:hypothetical protein
VSQEFKINPDFVLALDIFARPGRRPILITVDKQTADYSVYEMGTDTVADIITALDQEINGVEEIPAAIETDSAICFCHPELRVWLAMKGIEHRFRPLMPIVEALIRQNSTDWSGQ